jgi:4-amino-4-deoxy-L-arabinose transferase
VSLDRRLALATLLLLCFFTFLIGLGDSAITDADEAYYAEASREMVESGNWLTPQFNYQHRWEKPPLYYWLTSATYLVTGPTELAARFWSALSGVGLALLTWGIARHITARLDVAWLAGAVAATSFGYFSMARAALPDLPLAFCVTLCIWAALRAASTTGSSSMTWWTLAGFGAGAGLLMKGPVALAVPAVVLLPIAWRERRRLQIDLRGLSVTAGTAAAIGLPWYVAMWLEHGNAYLQSFFVADNFERFTTGRFNDPRPVWFYLPVLLGGLMPWSLHLVAFSVDALARARRRRLRLTDTDWRLLFWTLMPILFFTVSVGKQPRYILPVLPPLAVFVARGILERIGHQDRVLTAATWITAAVYAALAILFLRMEPLFINAYAPATWIAVWVLGGSAIALAALAATSSWRLLPLATSVAGGIVLISVWFGALAGNRPEAVEQMATLIRSQRVAEEPIGVLDVFTRNLVFYTGSRHMPLYDVEQAGQFLHSPQRVLLVLRSADIPAVEAASSLMVKRLGETRYLNTANIRLRTLLRPDPATEIEIISLVTNR